MYGYGGVYETKEEQSQALKEALRAGADMQELEDIVGDGDVAELL